PPAAPPPPPRRSRRSLPPPAPPPRRCGPGIRRPSRLLPEARSGRPASGSFGYPSEVQPALAGTVGQRRDATGVPVATAVEDDRTDAGRLRALGDLRADLASQGRL